VVARVSSGGSYLAVLYCGVERVRGGGAGEVVGGAETRRSWTGSASDRGLKVEGGGAGRG
jgi:hypothetical protein